MTNIKTILFLIFCPFVLKGQNIISNGSFLETYQANFGITKAADWESPTTGSPDFMHPNSRKEFGVPFNFSGFQNAKKEQGYFGLLIYTFHTPNDSKRLREYIQNKFIKPLVKDSNYCLQLHISLADSCRYASKNKLGVYFSKNQINSLDKFFLPYIPQIMVSPDTFITEKQKWVKYNFEYQAQGGEEYITIGNFKDSTEIDTLLVGGGDKKNLNWQGTYYYIDDVYLGHCDSVPLDTPNAISENSLLSKLNGYPNPINEQFTLENNSKQPLTFQLYNLQGSKIQVAVQQSNNKFSFSMGHLPKGVYLLQIIGAGERATMKIIKD